MISCTRLRPWEIKTPVNAVNTLKHHTIVTVMLIGSVKSVPAYLSGATKPYQFMLHTMTEIVNAYGPPALVLTLSRWYFLSGGNDLHVLLSVLRRPKPVGGVRLQYRHLASAQGMAIVRVPVCMPYTLARTDTYCSDNTTAAHVGTKRGLSNA